LATDDEIVATYLHYYKTRSNEDFWAFEEVSEIFRSGNRDRAWAITCALIEKAPDEDALSYVAAGPLEDYVGTLDALEQVREIARGSRKMQLALLGVGVDPDNDKDIWEPWLHLLEEFGFADHAAYLRDSAS
jgi:hypothetical protein